MSIASFQSTKSVADTIPRGSLPLWYQNKVLELNESNGGIELCFGADHHLAKILNNDPDSFGVQED